MNKVWVKGLSQQIEMRLYQARMRDSVRIQLHIQTWLSYLICAWLRWDWDEIERRTCCFSDWLMRKCANFAATTDYK